MDKICTLFLSLLLYNVSYSQSNISTARTQSIGTTVTVKGVVTNGSELGQARFLQDATGGISLYHANYLSNVNRGDSLTVTGQLSYYRGLLQVNVNSSPTIHANNINLPIPNLINPLMIGELTESQLIRIDDVVFSQSGGTFGVGIHDFSSNNQNSNIYIRPNHPLVGSKIPIGSVNLIGISSQYSFSVPANDGYQILLRDQNDIILPNGLIYGCTDINALNYDSTAYYDDGSCQFATGCTDPYALNYDSTAYLDDGSCTFHVYGCNDSTANNYDSLVTINDSSCTYDISVVFSVDMRNETISSSGVHIRGGLNGWNGYIPMSDDNGDGIYTLSWDLNQNSRIQYNFYNGNTFQNKENIAIGSTCINGIDARRVLIIPDTSSLILDVVCFNFCSTCPNYGCTDSIATNYDPLATIDNGYCCYLSTCILGCTDTSMFNYDSTAHIDDGSCINIAYACIDSIAYNYTPFDLNNANTNDSSLCVDKIFGCTDPTSLYYNINANTSSICGTCSDSSGFIKANLSAPLVQNFDSLGFLQPFRTQTNNNFKAWNQRLGSTPSSSTGPTNDISLNGFYMYTESSSPNFNSTFVLQSECIDISALGTPSIRFSYHMYGAEMGSLILMINNDTAWSLSGNQGNQWHETQINLENYSQLSPQGYYDEPIKISFIGISLSTYTSDMAIDQVIIDEAMPYGCTDANALNYDSLAYFDDSSCVYACSENMISFSEVLNGNQIEFIEITNYSDLNCDLENWKLSNNTFSSSFTFPKIIIPKNGTWLSYKDSTESYIYNSQGTKIDTVNSSHIFSINNLSDTLYLTFLNDSIKSIVKALFIDSNNIELSQSYTNDFGIIGPISQCYTYETPGKENNICEILGCTDVLAANYCASCTVDNFSCTYISCNSIPFKEGFEDSSSILNNWRLRPDTVNVQSYDPIDGSFSLHFTSVSWFSNPPNNHISAFDTLNSNNLGEATFCLDLTNAVNPRISADLSLSSFTYSYQNQWFRVLVNDSVIFDVDSFSYFTNDTNAANISDSVTRYSFVSDSLVWDLSNYVGQAEVEITFQTVCSYTNYIRIDNINAFELTQCGFFQTNIAKNDVSCYGSEDGRAKISYYNPFSPNVRASFLWSNGNTNDTISLLSSGNYYVITNDTLNNCVDTNYIYIDQPDSIHISAIITNAVDSFSNDGTISLTVAGGGSSNCDIHSPILITEFNASTPDAFEIQNVSTKPVDVTGWEISVSNSYTDINSTEPVKQTLSGILNPGEILFWNDDVNSSNYWGANLYWNAGVCSTFKGWIIIKDNLGNTADAFVSCWSATDIASSTIGLSSVWSGDGFDGNSILIGEGASRISLGNLASSFTNQTLSIGQINPNLISLTTQSIYSFLWSTGDTTKDVRGLSAGNYDVVITDCNNCVDSFSFAIEVDTVFGCTDSNAFNFNQYANYNDSTCISIAYACINDSLNLNYTPFDSITANTNDYSLCCFHAPIYAYTDDTTLHNDLNKNLGFWLFQDTLNEVNWLYRTGSTPSSGTGPSADVNGGGYIYIESSSPNYPNKKASFYSACTDISSLTNPTIQFYHHMYGTSMGSLTLSINNDTVWSRSGDQGNQWSFNQIDLSQFSNPITIRFDAVTGTNFTSDIALDDIRIAEALKEGCFDPTAFNYDSTVLIINNSQCIYLGCTDSLALNFNPLASIDDSSCIARVYGCMDSSASNYDSIANTSSYCDYNCIIYAPYLQEFSTANIPASTCLNSPWVTSQIIGDGWRFSGSPAYSALGNGRQAGTFAWVDFSANDSSAILQVEDIDISNLVTPYLSFDYWSDQGSYNVTNNILNVELFDSLNWTTVLTLQLKTTGWQNFVVDLSNLSIYDNIIRLRFRAESGGSSNDYHNDLLLDNVRIDNAGCTDSISCNYIPLSVIDDGSCFISTYTISSKKRCFGDTTGKVRLSVNDTVSTINWFSSDSTNLFDSTFIDNGNRIVSEIDNLVAGIYYFRLTNDYGCDIIDTIEIVEPDPINFTSKVYSAMTDSSFDGIITLDSLTGSCDSSTSIYTFLWSNGDTTQNISNLQASNYCVTVSNCNGCYLTKCDSVLIGPRLGCTDSLAINYDSLSNTNDGSCNYDCSLFSIEIDSLVKPDCYGYYNGEISLKTNFCSSIIWLDDTIKTFARTGISSGLYSAIATTCDGVCVDSITINLSQPDSLSFQFRIDTLSGYISTNVSGGTSCFQNSFDFYWSNGDTTSSIIALNNGIYSLQVIDCNGCSATDSIEIKSGCTDSLAFNYNSFASIDDSSCISKIFGCTDNTAANFDSLANVDDGSCCLVSDSTIIISSNTNPLSVSCNNFIYLILNPNINSTQLNILWSNGSNDRWIMNICPGIYSVLVTDNNSCTATDTIIIGNVYGCTDSVADNFYKYAVYDDSSCLYYGCTDSTALNYDSTANVDDGSCYYPQDCNLRPIAGLGFSNVLHDRATLTFDDMNTRYCTVDQLRILYRELGTNAWRQKNMGSPTGYDPVTGICNSTSRKDKLLLGLSANTTYEWKIKVWYCQTGATAWVNGPNFTTLDDCPNVGNLTVSTPTSTKATFTWDNSNGVYSFVRLQGRVGTVGSSFFNIGGVGVPYGTYSKNKNGLVPGTSYIVKSRTWCDPNGGAYKAPSWTSFIYFTMPGSSRLEQNTIINDLDVYPNPSRDVFNISFNTEKKQDITLRIRNIVGEEVYKEDLKQHDGAYKKVISLKDYPKAIYFLEIKTKKGTINKKLILQ